MMLPLVQCAARGCKRSACASVREVSGQKTFPVCGDDYMRAKNGEALTMTVSQEFSVGYAAGRLVAV